MDPFFGGRGWYQQPDPVSYGFPQYPFRGVPVNRVDPWETQLPSYPVQRPAETNPAQKVMRIPVQFVGSKKVDRPGSALKIQKIFRGFLVRKCLKKIKDIKVQVDAIEERLADGGVVDLVRKDEKERLRMNETLMSLLIRLDSISGLDFGVRICRKIVIRKAIALQEKIDAIVAGDLKGDVEISEASNQGNGADCETVIQEGENNPNSVDVDISHLPIDQEKPNDSIDRPEISNNSGGEDKVMEVEGNLPEPDVIDVGVDCEVKVGESTEAEEENAGDSDNKGNRELLERMMEENEKMMSMMRQLFEKNEAQTHALNALTQRVEALENAMACDRLRKKKKKGSARRED